MEVGRAGTAVEGHFLVFSAPREVGDADSFLNSSWEPAGAVPAGGCRSPRGITFGNSLISPTPSSTSFILKAAPAADCASAEPSREVLALRGNARHPQFGAGRAARLLHPPAVPSPGGLRAPGVCLCVALVGEAICRG